MDKTRALSVLDGRYSKATQSLCDIFSEFGLIKHRVIVEIKWLEYMITELKFTEMKSESVQMIRDIADQFDIHGANRVKDIESTTNHDVKAVEYYIKEELEKKGIGSVKEWTHFCCTSEDINNTSYALMLTEGRDVLIETASLTLKKIEDIASAYKSIPMMSRTHGQPASPTTVGKEFVNFAWRIRSEINHLKSIEIEAKFNGATGNFNAHHAVYPQMDWIEISQDFISNYLKLKPLVFSTQINHAGYIAEIMHSMIRLSSVLIDFDRDIWGYISLGYFKQKLKEGEVGSSTMPHKVNPIDFENSEGNLGIGISMMEHLAVKLLKSRFQRDLSDSTVLRNLGSLFGYLLIGLKSFNRGIGKLALNEKQILTDLKNNPELLAEPIQTVMRVYNEDNPYEKLKELTRGKKIDEDVLAQFIDTLKSVPDDQKNRMKTFAPENYLGVAEKLVDYYFEQIN